MVTPLDYFKMEAIERLERMSTGLLELEQSPNDQSLISDLFREAHSLKGAAGVSRLNDVFDVCHKMEDLLSAVRSGSEQVTALMIDALLAATDAVQEMVAASAEERDCNIVPTDIIKRLDSSTSEENEIAPTNPEETRPRELDAHDKAPRIEQAREPSPEAKVPTKAPMDPTVERSSESENQPAGMATSTAPPASGAGQSAPSGSRRGASSAIASVPSFAGARGSPPDTVRLRVDMLETLGNRSGELMVAGDRLRQRLRAVRELHGLVRGQHTRHHANTMLRETLQPIADAVRRMIDDFTTDVAVIEPLIADIHEGMLDTRMLPLSVLFDQLPRFVRDYCRTENKQAELTIDGTEARVDRQVLEQLRGTMVHLIRNALSHGIESPDERTQRGKDSVGAVRLTTSRRGDRIRITCEDDGRGIDRQKVLSKAVADGSVTEAEAPELSPEQIDRLILRPGFTTAEIITDVSGRGVGMDVVLGRMEAMHGTLEIKSEPGKGTCFALEFPASLATLGGLLVEVAGHTYVVPTISVVRIARVKLSEIQTGAGGEALVNILGQAVPLVMLANLLGRGEDSGSLPRVLPVAIIRHRDRQIALGVDRLMGTQNIVGKGLGNHIRNVRGVAGATILGTGRPALILETTQLVEDAGAGTWQDVGPGRETEDETELAPLLVVDDSITTRMMEQSILESAGYEVETALSAEDALAKIEDSTYRLFVVDVEMPGLNGFQLTRKLRQDERFAETPIIIVTSLCKEEHRREGLEAGANAYIVKGEFDQNNLLSTVERLVGT